MFDDENGKIPTSRSLWKAYGCLFAHNVWIVSLNVSVYWSIIYAYTFNLVQRDWSCKCILDNYLSSKNSLRGKIKHKIKYLREFNPQTIYKELCNLV